MVQLYHLHFVTLRTYDHDTMLNVDSIYNVMTQKYDANLDIVWSVGSLKGLWS